MDKINSHKQYKPRDIAKKGWIVSSGSSEVSHYNFIIRLIGLGKLKANNYASGPKGRPFWRVSGAEIISYKKHYENINL